MSLVRRVLIGLGARVSHPIKYRACFEDPPSEVAANVRALCHERWRALLLGEVPLEELLLSADIHHDYDPLRLVRCIHRHWGSANVIVGRKKATDVMNVLARLMKPSDPSSMDGKVPRRAQFVVVRGPIGSALGSKVALYDEFKRNRLRLPLPRWIHCAGLTLVISTQGQI